MIKSYAQFIIEFIESSESVIDSKLQELEDLVSNFSDKNLMYEWENKNDHEVVINFSLEGVAMSYQFDVDDLFLTKTADGKIDFQTSVESIDEGLDIIEKDIYLLLGVSEKYTGDWDSSIKSEEAEMIMNDIIRISKVSEKYELYDSEDLISELQSVLQNYDNITSEFVIDSILFTDYSDESQVESKTDNIVKLGDKIMSSYGTEPFQVINAFTDAIRVIDRYYNVEVEMMTEGRKGRPKSARYKGRKIPGKYLAGPHPSKMKKEIDTYAGKKSYKKEWDADYKSGKGGEGKRVKTKKSKATKAFQKMFGDK
jgi:hypothetical protein